MTCSPNFHALLVLLGPHQVVSGEGGEVHHMEAVKKDPLTSFMNVKEQHLVKKSPFLDLQAGLPEPMFLVGAGAGICIEPEPKISKMGGSGNPD